MFPSPFLPLYLCFFCTPLSFYVSVRSSFSWPLLLTSTPIGSTFASFLLRHCDEIDDINKKRLSSLILCFIYARKVQFPINKRDEERLGRYIRALCSLLLGTRGKMDDSDPRTELYGWSTLEPRQAAGVDSAYSTWEKDVLYKHSLGTSLYFEAVTDCFALW